MTVDEGRRVASCACGLTLELTSLGPSPDCATYSAALKSRLADVYDR
jgi:hypothetical protein